MTRHDPHDRIERIGVEEAFQCSHCGHRWYYTRSYCPNCRGETFETDALGVGTVVAVTTVEVTPPDVRSPNWLALARFDDVRVLAQLEAPASKGDRVRFSGEYRLRSGDEHRGPRLTVVTEEE
ncbi:hypothetical protein ACFQJC_06885 [Haloferax namakaokahaiae]|uniref:DUF35 domain-containing protein n=1 Tax=Haloferax namakaokahaiae TaxID=1748331 RepID=A0ABD5ZDQ8_9EURY